MVDIIEAATREEPTSPGRWRRTLGKVSSRRATTERPPRGQETVPPVPLEMLPPRYRDGHPVSSAPMGNAAGLVFGDDGRVAWDRIWGDFCDLALAGGPPHRSSLLRAPRKVGRGDEAAQVAVLAELDRALGLVTGWPVSQAVPGGWIGLTCPHKRAAMWMEIAIRAENVDVRREGAVLLLPAGPAFRLDGEIKNVVTAVAKAHHYWTEHDGRLD